MYGSFDFRRDADPEGTPPRPSPTSGRGGRRGKRPRRRAGAREPDRPRLNPAEVGRLLAALIARPEVARAAARELDPAYFSGEPLHRIVWECLLECFGSYEPGEVPYGALRAAVADRLDASPVPIDATDRAAFLAEPEDVGLPIVPGRPAPVVRLPGLLFRAYEEARRPDPSAMEGLAVLRQFLIERGAWDEFVKLGTRCIDSAPGDFDSVLLAIQDRVFRFSRLGRPLTYGFDKFPDDPEPLPASGDVGGDRPAGEARLSNEH